MRTTLCPEYKVMVGKESDSFPFFRFGRHDETSPEKKVFLSFVLGAIAILLLVFVMPDTTSDQASGLALNKQKAVTRWQEINHSSSAYIMASIYVRERLKFPGSAKFPTLLEGQGDHVTSLGKQQYHVVSYVDMEDEFGRMVRILFQGEIERIKEDEWRLISLNTQRATEDVVISLKASSK